jgi:putative FmdB family regulatory protein
MPIYEYECAKCGKKFEVIQQYSDKPLKKHEKCGGSLTKLISAAGFQFKGTGWYVTDYARKGSNQGTESSNDSKKDSQEKTSSNGSKEGTTDTSSSANAGKNDKSAKPSKSRSKKD